MSHIGDSSLSHAIPQSIRGGPRLIFFPWLPPPSHHCSESLLLVCPTFSPISLSPPPTVSLLCLRSTTPFWKGVNHFRPWKVYLFVQPSSVGWSTLRFLPKRHDAIELTPIGCNDPPRFVHHPPFLNRFRHSIHLQPISSVIARHTSPGTCPCCGFVAAGWTHSAPTRRNPS